MSQIQQMDSRTFSSGMQGNPTISQTNDAQSVYRNLSREDRGVKTQPCARTLLPPLAPLGPPKCESRNELQTTTVLMKNDVALSGKLSMSDDGRGSCITGGAKVTVSSPQADHLV